ncbi:MAG: tRNA 2-thiouridine(34) synthase MnmA [Helicobacteraceae bacterium]|nr:tRNA 2-thiouridine(34) synthase MnmA [Helicobacteraceae bacterium]
MSGKKKVLVAMSGGVDSSMSAKLLLEQGYEVHGAYMKMHSFEDRHAANIEKGRKVAAYFGFTHHVLDKREEFAQKVYTPFINIYKEGKTPNPCTFCNRYLKFGALAEFADSLGCEYVATGHYIKTDGEFFYEATDTTKDQSYFLFNVRKETLKRLIFPLADWRKPDVKKMAAAIPELAFLATQRESAEICFVETDYIDIIGKHFNVEQAGDVLDENGKTIGSHKGYMQYTIGKRRGFTVGGAKEPLYVQKILPEDNKIVVAPKSRIYQRAFDIEKVNLFFEPPQKTFRALIKVRYRNNKQPGVVTIDENGGAKAVLDEPEFAIASGQAAVFYEDNKLLGGGYVV